MKEKNKEEFQVIIKNEEQNKVVYDFAKEIFGPDSKICFKRICTKYPIRVYFYDFGRKKTDSQNSQKYCCGWDLISDNSQKHIPELTFEQFNQKYIMKIDESKIKRVLKSKAIKFSSEFEQKQFHLFLEENGVKNEQRHKENTVPTLIISLAEDNGYIPPRLDYIVLHEDQVLTTYKKFVDMCGKKIISPDEFLKLLEKPDVFMPKINGHDKINKMNKKFLSKLDIGKIKINWNKRPIEMKKFLSFLKVDLEKSKDHLGYNNGWTKRIGENNLIIYGGIINGVEYLYNIQYGKNLDNLYNNYVNPFYIFEIINGEGKLFFLDYYKKDIDELLEGANKNIKKALSHLKQCKLEKKELDLFWEGIMVDTDKEIFDFFI